ncbi:MAG: PAS domain-containing protein [Actinobacteria bacterium]|nr:PAS domain-containing protein [Actinomycetota bacterium]
MDSSSCGRGTSSSCYYKRRVKIYATDIDGAALTTARAARFPACTLEPLTDQQRSTYFETDGDVQRFRSDLRPSLIFGRHDLLQDAPISRIVLLACSNVRMYFTPEAQTRVLERFSYALHEDGLLLLGKAEMLLTQSHLFTPVSLPHRIFRSRRPASAGTVTALPVGGPQPELVLRRTMEAAFVGAAGAQVVLDANGVVTLLNQGARRSLGLSLNDVGRSFAELELSRVPVDLRPVLVGVQTSREPVHLQDIAWRRGAADTCWDIRITVLDVDGDVLGTQLVFEEVTQRVALRTRLNQLHDELGTAYEELQSSSEELETTNEELQSSSEELETTNEELQSAIEELETTNEELQSTNEELETMNEELQSTNEELQTVNDELRDRTVEIDRVNGFLHGILEGLDVAVAVVDTNHRVQMWNAAAERLSGLRAFESVGVLLLELPLSLPAEQTLSALREVLVRGGARDAGRAAARSVRQEAEAAHRGEPAAGPARCDQRRGGHPVRWTGRRLRLTGRWASMPR